MRVSKSICAAVCVLSLSGMAVAQPSINYEQIKSSHPSEDFYYLSYKENLTLKLKSGKVDVVSDNSSEMLFLSDKANLFGKKSIYYSKEIEDLDDIQALTYVPKEGKYKKFKVENFETVNPLKDGSVFYDDYLEKSFQFPAVQPGAIATLSYQRRIRDPHFIGTFYFPQLATREAEYSVTFPKEISVKYLTWGDTTGIRFNRTEDRKQVTYTWKATDIKRFVSEENSPDFSYFIPHIYVYIDSYNSGGRTYPVLSNVNELYKWYYSLVKDARKEPGPQLKLLVDSLTSSCKTPDEKARSIFYWVQDHISYIAFEYGMGGFVPRDAEFVCSKRYGDCKDMANLLSTMLNTAGIPAHLTWIGTRKIPYTYSQLPTPSVDNHMIVAAKLHGEWLFFDATGKFIPYGSCSYATQEKEALIGLSADSFQVVKLPSVPMEKNLKTDSIAIHIEKDGLAGKGYTRFTGYSKYNVILHTYYASSKDRSEELSKFLKKGNNKCRIDSVSCQGLEDRDSPLQCSYRLSLSDYMRKIDNTLYVNMNLDKPFEGDIIDIDKRKTDREQPYRIIDRQIITLDIPKGYHAGKLPQDSDFHDEQFGYHTQYTKKNSQVILERTIYTNYLLLSKKSFPQWNKMVASLKDSYKEVVQLEKN